MTAIAISLKSESGDNYLFCYDLVADQDVKYVVNAISEIMDGEMAYIYDYEVCISNEDKSLEQTANKLISAAIDDAKNNYGEEDE